MGDNEGVVTLVWRLVKTGKDVAGFTGAEALRHDVFPGCAYKFQIPFLPVPPEPGQYVLELEMVSAPFGGFSREGRELLAIPVTIPTRTPEILLQSLDTPAVASTDIPKLTFALDRPTYHPGEHVRITYRLAGAKKPVPINAYLALRHPNGDVSLATVSGQRIIRRTDHFRSEDSIHINKEFLLSGALDLPLREDLPLGRFTLYFGFTEAGSYQIITRATAQFLLDP
jgi:hypothetical protein